MKVINTLDDLAHLRSSKEIRKHLWNEIETKFSSLYKNLYPEESIFQFSLQITGTIVVLEPKDNVHNILQNVGIGKNPLTYKPEWWIVLKIDSEEYFNFYIAFSISIVLGRKKYYQTICHAISIELNKDKIDIGYIAQTSNFKKSK